MTLNIIHFCICSILLFAGIGIIMSADNMVNCILYLVLLFVASALSLFLFQADFIATIFIIIYVGAIAILFLFITMMMKLKPKKVNFFYQISAFILAFSIFASLYVFSDDIQDLVVRDFVTELHMDKYNFFLIDFFSSIDIIGQFLFNYYFLYFLITGLILLIALVGAIILSLNFDRESYKQITNKQLSRTDKFLSFFN